METITIELSKVQAETLVRILNDFPVQISVGDLRNIASGQKQHSIVAIADQITWAIRRASMPPAPPIQEDVEASN